MKRSTIQDVANLAKVSNSAVSRYFNNPSLINDDYSKRIEHAIEELNYSPLSSARNLRLGSTNIVGYIMPDISQEFFATTIKALNDQLFDRNYLLISCDTNNEPSRERKLITMLIQQDVRALIVVTCGNNTAFLKSLAEKFENLILFIRDEPEVKCCSIHEDQIGNTYKLTKHMINLGCKNFGILSNIPYSSATSEGMNGINQACKEYNVTIKEQNISNNCKDTTTSFNACMNILENDSEIDCILYINQRSTEGVYQAVNHYNKKYNKNIQIGGFSSSTFMNTIEDPFPAIIEDPIPVGKLLADITMEKIFSVESNFKSDKIKLETHTNFI